MCIYLCNGNTCLSNNKLNKVVKVEQFYLRGSDSLLCTLILLLCSLPFTLITFSPKIHLPLGNQVLVGVFSVYLW